MYSCVYSDKVLNQDKIQDFKQSLDVYDYFCDIPLFSDDHYLTEILFVHVKISCDIPIEILYYSSQKLGNINVCYYCDTNSDFIELPSILRTKYKIIYSLYQGCQDKGKEFSTHSKIKVNSSSLKCRKIS